MTDATPRMYAWEVAGGACGASRDRDQVLAVVGQELTGSVPGTTAAIVEVLVSAYEISYVPVRVLARAERTGDGVIWRYASEPVPVVPSP